MDVGDASQPQLVYLSHGQSLDEIGVPGEVVLTVSGFDLPSLHPAKQPVLPHQTQYSLMIDKLVVLLKLFGYPAVAIAGEIQADLFDTSEDVRVIFRWCLSPVIECASGKMH
jgi:hypothetical protein